MGKNRNEATSPHFILGMSPQSQGQSQSECRHQESFTLHLYLLTDSGVRSGSSFSISVPGPVSLVICLVSKRWADTPWVWPLGPRSSPVSASRHPSFTSCPCGCLFPPLSLPCESRTDGNSNSWELSASLRSVAFVVCHWGSWQMIQPCTHTHTHYSLSHSQVTDWSSSPSVFKGSCVLLSHNGPEGGSSEHPKPGCM